jgi:cytochrome P450
MEASLTLVGYYQDLVAERRRKPSTDLTSALLAVEEGGDRLTENEIIAFLFLMVVAGNETTTKLLANALYWGARNAVRVAYPAQVGPWIEETLRYDTSSQMIARMVAKDTEYYGHTVREGERILLLVGSANRDPRIFPEPDVYDLGRDTSDLISFGGGRHFCLGANLARLEARLALTEFVTRVRSYAVDEANAVRVHSVNVRGFAALPISVSLR